MDQIDSLVHTTTFAQSENERNVSRQKINSLARENNIVSASILPLYVAFGKGQVAGFTTPAMNIRTLTYDIAQVIFTLAKKHSIGSFVFEIARSEMEYTMQTPSEYTASILAAAIKTGYSGVVFLQGDHFQVSKKHFTENRNEEMHRLKTLILDSLNGGFYNIDIDASTLVDLRQVTIDKQQEPNYTATAELTNFIRENQPEGVTVSIGGEIGHIGGVNSTVEDFEVFMQGYLNLIKNHGISKVSVQTGTSHGGMPDENGHIKKADVDFSVLEKIGKVAREKYGLGGTVQHGASTLPLEFFDKFPSVGTLEIHLSTGLQNIVYNNLPQTLRDEMYAWVKQNCQKDWQEEWNETQFIYKLRKKALGPFKEKLWNLSPQEKTPIHSAMSEYLETLFLKLKCENTKEVVKNIFPNFQFEN